MIDQIERWSESVPPQWGWPAAALRQLDELQANARMTREKLAYEVITGRPYAQDTKD